MTEPHTPEPPRAGDRGSTVGSLISRVVPSPQQWRGLIEAVKTPIGLAALAVLAILAILTLLISSGAIGEGDWLYLLPFVLITLVSLVYIVAKAQPQPNGGRMDIRNTIPVGLPKDFPPVESLDMNLDIISPLPILEVVIDKEEKGGETEKKETVNRISPSAKEFFGYSVIHPTQEIVGMKASDLMARLASRSDPPRPFWDDLVGDQTRVYWEVEHQSRAYARVPVKFNDTHEFFKGKTFVPIITELRKLPGNRNDKTLLRILYLDMDTLPKTLFTGTVWNNVIEGLDLNDLASDLEQIRDRFSEERFVEENDQQDNEERTRRTQALESAIERLRSGNDPQAMDDLSRAGWFTLRSVAEKMVDRPDVALKFIDRILRP